VLRVEKLLGDGSSGLSASILACHHSGANLPIRAARKVRFKSDAAMAVRIIRPSLHEILYFGTMGQHKA
jgi:hypothetical protein